MKHSTLFVAITFIFIFIFSFKTSEAFIIQPFGGRVIAAPVIGTVCPSSVGGAISIRPAGIFPPGPYDISTSSTQKTVTIGGWILGKYNTIMSPETCQIVTPAGSVPLPTFPVLKYGTGSSFLK